MKKKTPDAIGDSRQLQLPSVSGVSLSSRRRCRWAMPSLCSSFAACRRLRFAIILRQFSAAFSGKHAGHQSLAGAAAVPRFRISDGVGLRCCADVALMIAPHCCCCCSLLTFITPGCGRLPAPDLSLRAYAPLSRRDDFICQPTDDTPARRRMPEGQHRSISDSFLRRLLSVCRRAIFRGRCGFISAAVRAGSFLRVQLLALKILVSRLMLHLQFRAAYRLLPSSYAWYTRLFILPKTPSASEEIPATRIFHRLPRR